MVLGATKARQRKANRPPERYALPAGAPMTLDRLVRVDGDLGPGGACEEQDGEQASSDAIPKVTGSRAH